MKTTDKRRKFGRRTLVLLTAVASLATVTGVGAVANAAGTASLWLQNDSGGEASTDFMVNGEKHTVGNTAYNAITVDVAAGGVTVKAAATNNEGYRFCKWEYSNSTNRTVTLDVDSGSTTYLYATYASASAPCSSEQ